MKSLAAGCGLSLFILLSVTAGNAAPTPAPKAAALAKQFVPGTYRQVDTVTNVPLDVGNLIVIVAGKPGQIGFSIGAVRQADTNGGFVVGVLPLALPATWSRTSSAGNCRVSFAPLAHGLKVTQDAGFGDCGLGEGASAGGTYVLIPEKPLKT
jgi:hypothetical protein